MATFNGETKEVSRRKRAKRKAQVQRAMRLSVVALGVAAVFAGALLVAR